MRSLRIRKRERLAPAINFDHLSSLASRLSLVLLFPLCLIESHHSIQFGTSLSSIFRQGIRLVAQTANIGIAIRESRLQRFCSFLRRG